MLFSLRVEAFSSVIGDTQRSTRRSQWRRECVLWAGGQSSARGARLLPAVLRESALQGSASLTARAWTLPRFGSSCGKTFALQEKKKCYSCFVFRKIRKILNVFIRSGLLLDKSCSGTPMLWHSTRYLPSSSLEKLRTGSAPL